MVSANTIAKSPSNDAVEQALLNAWLDVAELGLFTVDDTARVVMLNRAACKLLHIDGIDALHQPLKRLFASFAVAAPVIQWLSTPGFDGEKTIVWDSPAGFSVELLLRSRSIKTQQGEHLKVVAVSDVTALLTARRELEAQQRQWQAINAGVVVSDALLPDMPIIYVNSIFEQMSGYKLADIKGRNCRFLQGKDVQQEALQDIRRAIREENNGYALLRNYKKDGTLFMNELFVSPVRDSQGIVTHFLGVQHLRN
jgi:PAS domain S-box-containing protein